MGTKGKLYLIPSSLGGRDLRQTLPEPVFKVINEIDDYIVENVKSAASFLKNAGLRKPLIELSFRVLNVNTINFDAVDYLEPVLKGKNMGLIPEAGLPCVADPGANIVAAAHDNGVTVVPLAGPSSIMLALMASGLNGQNFAFNGYLPIKTNERKKKLKELEAKIKKDGQTQIFIEAPHRNADIIKDISETCSSGIKLCVAANLTMPDETIITKPVSLWRKTDYRPGKVPATFLIGK